MKNDNSGQNQNKNDETLEQTVARLRKERNSWKKEAETQTHKKSKWREKAEALLKTGDPEKKGDKKPKSGESDNSAKALENSQRALLNSMGYKLDKQQEYVLEAASKYKQDISEILNDDFHKSKLKAISDTHEAQDGMSKGQGKGGGNKGSLEYYLAKGEAPNDPELRDKYFEAREKAETNKNMFSDELYTSAESESKMAED